MKLYRNWIINEVARAGEHTNECTYVLTYIRTGQTLYPLHNKVVEGIINLEQRTTCIKAQKWPPTKLTNIVMNNSCVAPLTEIGMEIGDRH